MENCYSSPRKVMSSMNNLSHFIVSQLFCFLLVHDIPHSSSATLYPGYTPEAVFQPKSSTLKPLIDMLHCLPIHSSSSLLACSLNYSHYYLYPFAIPFFPIFNSLLIQFKFQMSWSSWASETLNSLAPLLSITLSWQHIDSG